MFDDGIYFLLYTEQHLTIHKEKRWIKLVNQKQKPKKMLTFGELNG